MNTLASLHSLKGAPASLLLALLADPGPLGVGELAERTGWCPDRVARGLRLLSALGLVENLSCRRGWQLSDKARALFAPGCVPAARDVGATHPGDPVDPDIHLPSSFSRPFAKFADEALSSGACPEPALEGRSEGSIVRPDGWFVSISCSILAFEDVQLAGESVNNAPEEPPYPASGEMLAFEDLTETGSSAKIALAQPMETQTIAKIALDCPSEAGMSAKIALPALKEVVKLNTLKSEDLTTSPDLQTRARDAPESRPSNGPPVSSARLLAASEALFGEPVHGPPERYPDPGLLLACIAQAYHQRERLLYPARVVYANLRRGRQPPARYREDPCAYLPAEFLLAAGLPAPPEPETPEPEPADLPDEPPPEPHPSLALPVRSPPAPSAAEAWRQAREVLQGQIPRHVFAARVAGLRLLRYEPDENRFTLGAPGTEARDWLESRLAPTLARLLLGICARPAAVRFVVEGSSTTLAL